MHCIVPRLFNIVFYNVEGPSHGEKDAANADLLKLPSLTMLPYIVMPSYIQVFQVLLQIGGK